MACLVSVEPWRQVASNDIGIPIETHCRREDTRTCEIHMFQQRVAVSLPVALAPAPAVLGEGSKTPAVFPAMRTAAAEKQSKQRVRPWPSLRDMSLDHLRMPNGIEWQRKHAPRCVTILLLMLCKFFIVFPKSVLNLKEKVAAHYSCKPAWPRLLA